MFRYSVDVAAAALDCVGPGKLRWVVRPWYKSIYAVGGPGEPRSIRLGPAENVLDVQFPPELFSAAPVLVSVFEVKADEGDDHESDEDKAERRVWEPEQNDWDPDVVVFIGFLQRGNRKWRIRQIRSQHGGRQR